MFGLGKNSFLGIDIGTSLLKVVELTVVDNKPVLSNYAWMHIDTLKYSREGSFDVGMAGYLKKILKDGKFKSKNAYVSIPAFGGLITLIEFPEMPKEDLDQAIKFEAHKYIPTSLDDVVLSWDIVDKNNADSFFAGANASSQPASAKVPPGKLHVLLVAAPKNKVIKYEKLIQEADLELKAIEIESFALVRSLIGNDPGNFVIVDIGYRICNIIVVEKGVVKISRNIDAGGRDITQTIARSMNIESERAEKFKVSGRNFLNQESSITFPALDFVLEEIRRILLAYYKNEADIKVEKVILSGGTSGLTGVEDHFSSALNIPTIIGNPLSRIEYDHRLDPVLVPLRGRFSVCIGLAVKGAEEYLNSQRK